VKRLVFLVLCAACGRAPRTHEVAIRNFRIEPDSLTVHVGDTVRWRNFDFVPHTVTAAGSFDSGEIAEDSTWTLVATRGRYDYICTLHPNMKGRLIVE
jgi:plastocyanin